MSGGMEILALTGGAVQPLLFDRGETGDNIDGKSLIVHPILDMILSCAHYMHVQSRYTFGVVHVHVHACGQRGSVCTHSHSNVHSVIGYYFMYTF